LLPAGPQVNTACNRVVFGHHAGVLSPVNGGARVLQDQPGGAGGPGLGVSLALLAAARILRNDLAAYGCQQHPGVTVGVARPVRQHMTPAPAGQQRQGPAVVLSQAAADAAMLW
jgi:hypothetical protein